MNNLILHASRDYDINIDIVENIYNKYPNDFYERLEEYIKIRSQQNEN
jgi:hypothetical protein